jgi:hypothetical protein
LGGCACVGGWGGGGVVGSGGVCVDGVGWGGGWGVGGMHRPASTDLRIFLRSAPETLCVWFMLNGLRNILLC